MAPSAGKSTIGVRVRPNAHDFIRDLRAQLGTKKYTFYVDVGARTGQASRDVRTWANGTLQKIHAAIPVSANMGPATRDLAEWRRRQAGTKTTINVGANMAPANRDVEAWRQIAGRDLEVRVKANVSERGLDRVRKAATKDATINVRADATKAKRDIKEQLQSDEDSLFTIGVDANTKKAKLEVREFFEEMRGEQLSLDLDMDTTPAKEAIKEVAAEAKAMSPKQKLDLDLKQAKLDLLQLRIQEKAKKLEIDVQVKKGAVKSARGALESFEKGLGSLTLVRSLDAGPLNLGKPTGLIGTLTTVTALAAAVPTLVTGLAALSNGFIQLSAAASLAPGAIGGVLASLGTFAVATKGVSDAVGALAELWDEGASEQASAMRRQVQAQNNYRNALVDEERAQTRVSEARREALGDLRNLNNELRGSVLNEAQALLDLQKAKDRYAQGDFENETDRMQALLDIDKATLNLDQTREKAIDTQNRANEAGAKGVEGSDKVVDALEAQTRAQQQAAEAMEAMASSQATGALGKFNDQLAQLSPNAQAFVMALADAKGPLQQFRNDIQDTFFAGLDQRVGGLFQNLLPEIEPGMQAIAQAMNQNILQVFDTLESPDGKSIIDRILGGTAEAQKALTQFIDPFVKGFGTLIAAGAEHLPQVVDLMTRLADRFAKFITDADKSGALDKFLDQGVTALSNLAEIGINLVEIVTDFSDAFQKAFGKDILTTVREITDKWHEFLSSKEGQDKLLEFIQEARDIWAEWKPILEDLPGVFESVQDAAQAVLKVVLPFIETFTSWMKEHPGIVATFIGAWLGAKVLITPLTAIFNIFQGLFKLIAKIPGVMPILSKLASYAKGIMPGGGGILTGPGVTPPGQTVGASRFGAGGALGATGGLLAAGAFVYGADQWSQAVASDNGVVNGGVDTAGAAGAGLALTPFGAGALPFIMATNPAWAQSTFNSGEDNAAIGLRKAVMDRAWKDFQDSPDKDAAAQRIYGPLANGKMTREQLENVASTAAGVPSFAEGGYTNWPQQTGNLAMLHGKEYIQPADTVGHYGVDAMKAVHDKKAVISFQTGGYNWDGTPRDPNAPTPLRASEPNPSGGGWLNALQTGVQSGIQLGSGLAAQAGGVDPNSTVHGASNGAPPGPTDGAAPGSPATTPNQVTMDLFGIKIPIGGAPAGWPDGKAPVGLGGGEDGFDIRKYGIGPGPVGSNPGDWANFAGKIAGNFITSATGGILTGFLDSIGLGGILANVQTASPLINHFLGGDKKAQAAGADETNANVGQLLNTFDSMAGNPAYPGVPGLPNVIDMSTGSALSPNGAGNGGLQINTLKGKEIIQKFFPWATNIGGVRKDNLKWHPQGLALDVMTDPGHDNNDPPSPEGLARGNQLYAWLKAHQQELGIDYMLWQEKDHYNHIHVNFAPSGYPAGGGPLELPSVEPPKGGTTARPGVIDNKPNGPMLPSLPKKGATGGSIFGKAITGHYKGGFVGSFYGGGMVPLADPNWHQGPGYPNPYDHSHQVEAIWGPNEMPIGTFPWQGKQGAAVSPVPGTNGSPIPGLVNPGSLGGGIGGSLGGGSGGGPDFKGGRNKVMDRGGWLMPGTTLVHNYTNKPEMVVPSYALGGLNVPEGIKVPKPPFPRPPDVQLMTPPPPQPAPPAVAPQIPSVTPSVPPPAPPQGAPPAPQPQAGPGGAPISVGPRPIQPVGPDQDGMHLHPALQKGIASGAAVAGNLASSAIGALSGGMGGGGMGGLGGFVSGLIQQGGKILTNIANVGASFLVGNITGGTTANAYGVTQRGSQPSGGTRVVDASNNQYGDIYTNNLDEYFARKRRQEAVSAQSRLGRWADA